MRVWQRNYYDWIIRDEKALYAIRRYIRVNPALWAMDCENHPDNEVAKFYPESEIHGE
jgi:hypothetical protein